MFLIPPILALIIWMLRSPRTVTSILLFDGKATRPWQTSLLPFWIITLAATLAAAAFHDPKLTYAANVPETCVPNLAIAIDLSGSMNAVDWTGEKSPPEKPDPQRLPPTRLESAKEHVRKLLRNLPQARAALLAFADNTVLASPLTARHTILLQRLKALKPELFEDGTAIGNALRAAVQALACAPPGPKAVILLSDGVDHSHDSTERGDISPSRAAAMARSQHIVVHTVAIGGANAYHPVATDQGIRWENVGEPLDERQLTHIATQTGGTMFKAADHRQLADAIRQIQLSITSQARRHKVLKTLRLNPFILAGAAMMALIGTALAMRHETDHP